MARFRRPLLLRLVVEAIDVPQSTLHVMTIVSHSAGGSSTASCSCISCVAAARSKFFAVPGRAFARYGMAHLRRRRDLARVVSLNAVNCAFTRAFRAPVLNRDPWYGTTFRPVVWDPRRNVTPRIEILGMGPRLDPWYGIQEETRGAAASHDDKDSISKISKRRGNL